MYETLSSDLSQFTMHPNFHITSAFVSGFVFWGSLHHLWRSPFAHYVRLRIVRRISAWPASRHLRRAIQSEPDKEAQNLFAGDVRHQELDKGTSFSDVILGQKDNPALVLVLTLFIFMGSLSQFVSSLVVGIDLDEPSARDRALCAFVVAWDSMSFQSARLIGLTVLGLDLGALGVKWIEKLIFWVIVGVVALLVILSNALAPGEISQSYLVMFFQHGVDEYGANEAMALCYRQHKVAPSLVLSLVAMCLEVYCILRFLDMIAPPHFPLQRRLDVLFRDIHIVRGFSLLIFDLIVVVPGSVKTTYLGDSLPFSIAALIVLAAFNDYHPPLLLFHDVAPQTDNKISLPSEPEHLVRYKALVTTPHPFSAAALSMNVAQPDLVRLEGYTGLITTSGSERVLLSRAVRSSTYNPTNKRNDRAPTIPILPPILTSRPPRTQRTPWLPKSRSQPGSRKIRASSHSQKSQKSHLVRPIVPKAELARQFNDSERSADSENTGILMPRPPPYTHRTTSAPIQLPPAATLRSRPHSTAESMVHTLASESVRYGSDILRPEPGRPRRDKMRASPSTRAQTPQTSKTRLTDRCDSGGSAPSRANSRRLSNDSWVSDGTVDAYTVARLVPAIPSMPTFSGGWPAPPSVIPADKVRDDRRKRSDQPTEATCSRLTEPVELIPSLNPADGADLSAISAQASVRATRRPSSARGPRMQLPPPRSRAFGT